MLRKISISIPSGRRSDETFRPIASGGSRATRAGRELLIQRLQPKLKPFSAIGPDQLEHKLRHNQWTKNWLNGSTYDLNGNVTTLNNATLSYDVENRLTGYTTGTFAENYAYDEGNRRVEKWNSSGSDNIYFYAPGGKLLTVVQVNTLGSSPWMTLSTVSNRVYFGGMLLGTTTGYAISDEDLIKDRLGSVQPSYAYGTDTGSGQQTSPGDDFATYWKDSSSGFEYAMNRYYSAGYGRFLTVDPFGGSAHVRIPQSWNRYQYAASDPVNRRDPSGLGDGGSDDINCVDGLANDDGVYIACGGTPTFYSDSSDSADGGKDDDGDQGGNDYWDDPWDTGGITDQVQTKGTRGRNKSVSKVLRSLPAAIALAMQALQNADCASLMGTAPGSPSPSTVLGELQTGTSGLGYFAINNIDSSPGTVVSATTQASGYSTVPIDGGFQSQATSVTITINDLAGYFVGNNLVDQAATIIHELGHAFYDLPSLGGSLILPDAGNVSQSEANQALVMQTCFPSGSQ